MKIKLTKEEARVSLPALYDLLLVKAQKRNPSDDDIYDCRKVDVSLNVFHQIEDFYLKEEHLPRQTFNMYWVNWGPHALPELKDYDVVLHEGWLKEANQ